MRSGRRRVGRWGNDSSMMVVDAYLRENCTTTPLQGLNTATI